MVLRLIASDSIAGAGMERIRTLWAILFLTPTIAASAATLIDTYTNVQWETYTHAAPDFSLQYPYQLHAATPSRPGEVFSASGPTRLPTISVVVVPRQSGVTLDKAAATAAKLLAPDGTIKAQQQIDLDGVAAEAVTIEWSVPIGSGVDLRSIVLTAYQGDSCVIVTGTDGRVSDAIDPQLALAVESVRFGH
jgi:hypothetical protein